MSRRIALALVVFLLTGAARSEEEIHTALAHPIYRGVYVCTEHWAGQLKALGDALGSDCIVQRLVEVKGRTWLRAHEGDGRRNADWFGWQRDVLSPCTCEVTQVHINPVVNQPGIMGQGRASSVILKREDGVMFVLAHIDKPKVQAGDQVVAGQALAQVGNNGYSRSPHIHIAAWQGKEPLQIRFDQNKMTDQP